MKDSVICPSDAIFPVISAFIYYLPSIDQITKIGSFIGLVVLGVAKLYLTILQIQNNRLRRKKLLDVDPIKMDE